MLNKNSNFDTDYGSNLYLEPTKPQTCMTIVYKFLFYYIFFTMMYYMLPPDPKVGLPL